jgi:transposase
MYYAGIDYHKRYSNVCILSEGGEIALEAMVKPNTQEGFAALFARLDGPVKAVFECGLNWGYLYDLLQELPVVDEVVLAHAAQTRIIAEAQIKTDKIDARKLAWLLRADLVPSVHIPDPHTRSRKEVIRQRIHWVKSRTRIRNRIHRIVERQRHLNLPQVTDLFGKKGKAAMSKAKLPEPDGMLLRQNLEMLDELDRLVREDEALMKAEGKCDPQMQWMLSIPGIGLTIGSILATEIDGIKRFRGPEKLCAYAGLCPSTYSSGGKTRQGRMLMGSNKWLKWGFIEAAWVAVGCSPYFGGLYRAQRQRGKQANTAITIVARRMCRIVWDLLINERHYEERMYTGTTPGRPPHGLTESSRVA